MWYLSETPQDGKLNSSATLVVTPQNETRRYLFFFFFSKMPLEILSLFQTELLEEECLKISVHYFIKAQQNLSFEKWFKGMDPIFTFFLCVYVCPLLRFCCSVHYECY